MPRSLEDLKKEISKLEKKKRDAVTRKNLEEKLQRLKSPNRKQKESFIGKMRERKHKFRRRFPHMSSSLDLLSSAGI